MRLGNKKDAELIYRRRRSGAGPLPKGWRKLGAGAYRTSYLSPDGVVYKVCHPEEGDEWNSYEFRNFIRIRKDKTRLPKGWRVAPAKLYSFNHDESEAHVVAMEYVEGEHMKISEDDDWEEKLDGSGATRAFRACNIWDVHEGNFVITRDGKKVIIDLGE